jgi:hypothetical protein
VNFPYHEKLIPFLEHLETCSRDDFEHVALDYARRSVIADPNREYLLSLVDSAVEKLDPREAITIRNTSTYAQIKGIYAAKDAGIENFMALNAIAALVLEEARRLLLRECFGEDTFSKVPKWPIDRYETPRTGGTPLASEEFIPSSGIPSAFLRMDE